MYTHTRAHTHIKSFSSAQRLLLQIWSYNSPIIHIQIKMKNPIF